jgi:hypothetical protein
MAKFILIAVFSILAIILLYSYITVSNGPINPLGRLSFVKIENPDMYPDHPHSILLAEYAEDRGSQCALVVHFAGSSNYRSYSQKLNDTNSNKSVYIIEAGFIDTQGVGSANLSQINKVDSLKLAVFGVPQNRYKYVSDGQVYNSYDDLMAHVYLLAKEHGQQGPIPMVWHGSVRSDNPNLNPGCGLPLYFQILSNTYGMIPAYVYVIYGLIFPYLHNPFANFELSNASTLQKLYNEGELNFDFVNISSNNTNNTLMNQTNNITQNITSNLPNYE